MSKGVLRLLKVVIRCYLEVETDSVLDAEHKGLDSDEGSLVTVDRNGQQNK